MPVHLVVPLLQYYKIEINIIDFVAMVTKN